MALDTIANNVAVAAGLAARLFQLGWIGSTQVGSDLEDAVKRFQRHFGLEQSGKFDRETTRVIEMPRYCGKPDVMAMTDVSRWSHKQIRWTVDEIPTGAPRTEIEAVFTLAWDAWARVCGIQPIRVGVNDGPNVLATFRELDGSGKTLAISEMPDGGPLMRRQTFDSLERWAKVPGPGRVDLFRVVCHEIGHAIGIGHLHAGCLMQPMYDPLIAFPQAGDIAEAELRYGKSTFG